MTQVPFVDFSRVDPAVQARCREGIDRVISRGDFVLGPEVARFEEEFASYLGAKYCVAVNSGTSALQLALDACGVGPGDEVITTPLTWISTSWAISYVGATPVFADVDPETYNLDPNRIEAAITPRTKALLPVHLYGRSADVDALRGLAEKHHLLFIEDAAQAHGARFAGRRVGTFGLAGCFSFYPTKNLGCFGEGGAVVTDDSTLAQCVRCLRDHAQVGRHRHVRIGYNARMETLQAAVLRAKLPQLDTWNARRSRLAQVYREQLAGVPCLELPAVARPESHVWHLFVALVGPGRDGFRARLQQRGVESRVHYPTLVPFQPAYNSLGCRPGSLPVAERVAAQCLSLPLYPELTDYQVCFVAEQLKSALSEAGESP